MHEYLVRVPDHPNSLPNRLAVRPTHLKALKPLIDDGTVVFGGATLATEFRPEGAKAEAGPEMTGSVMLVKFESAEKAREWMRSDAYAKEGVWDVEKAEITPFRCAVRTAL